jgi:polynucleotide 5'-kinase involved in rRNA processing
MPRTLLVAAPNRSWKDWIQENHPKAPVLWLDPASPEPGPAGRLALKQEERSDVWRFLGSTQVRRFPVQMLAAGFELIDETPEDAVAVLFALDGTPLLREMSAEIARRFGPEQILEARGAAHGGSFWPVGPEEVDLPESYPEMVRRAKRQARWIELFDACREHTLPMREVSFVGSRLGSGRVFNQKEKEEVGLAKAVRVELAAGTLLAVSEQDLSDDQISQALNATGAKRLNNVHPDRYEGLLISVARQDGTDFGMGVLDRIDFAAETIHLKATPVLIDSARILKMGSVRLQENGKELEEVKPWAL